MSGTTESARVNKINELLCERWRNTTWNRVFLMVEESEGVCSLEGVDRRMVKVQRKVLENPISTWERLH